MSVEVMGAPGGTAGVGRSGLFTAFACMVGLRGWVPVEAAVALVIAGHASARTVSLSRAQRSSHRRTVQVIDLDPCVKDLVAILGRMPEEHGQPRALYLGSQPMPRVIKTWAVSEAFLLTLPRPHLRHVATVWWDEKGTLFA